MTSSAEIYTKLHERRADWAEERERAWKTQCNLHRARYYMRILSDYHFQLASENARILAIIAEYQHRHSAGSQTRAVLDTIAVEIAEGREG